MGDAFTDDGCAEKAFRCKTCKVIFRERLDGKFRERAYGRKEETLEEHLKKNLSHEKEEVWL